ncbi:SWPV2-ORF283 [Shearwaterpox virus]|uniref:SWPV2-ORF283 n=1 Tax=Shearwaterpox virus TaxID=1974596 RepID=A0A1V0QGN4_CNPV|nr:SWPV2-ORF283 [Shearwaterpox virus]QRM15576.1 ankyrin repeat protein [Mudlarkpox virus]QRM15929.1 ankyrin repeat protein [Penguinpox virus 2]QRM16266.1 ankyrin repeat protein [Albatrosspox virus]
MDSYKRYTKNSFLTLEDIHPPLFSSVESRNISKVISLLENRADVNEVTNTNLTAMHSITNIMSLYELCNLIKTYGDTILLDNYIKTFFVYNETRNLEIAWVLLKYGADVNVQTDNGITPLHIAAESGSLKMVTLLLSNGANINSLTKYGESALHYAVSVKDLEMCRLLLQYKIDVNIKNSKCVTALHIAIEVESYDIMLLLLQHGADANVVSFYLEDIKRIKRIEKNEDLILTKYLRDIKLLDVDDSKLLNDYTNSFLNDIRRYSACSKLVSSSTYQHCTSPLIFLSKKGRINEVRLLLEDYKADPNIMDKYSCTPLHYSISKEHLDVSELLICNGADINARDWYRNTPSHYACSVVNGDSFIKILMDNGANIEERNEDNQTPLHIACKVNNIPVIKRLLTKGVLTNLADLRYNYPLQYAIESNSEESVRLLLHERADPNLCMDIESAPIIMAINSNNKEIVKLLLLFGANVEFMNECEILHKLANEKNCKMLKFLIQIDGVDLSRIDDEGFPLVYYISKLRGTSIMESIILNDFVDIHQIIRDKENVFTIMFNEYYSMSRRMTELIISYVAIQIHVDTENSVHYSDKGIYITRSMIESDKYLYAIYKSCETEILKMSEIKLSKKYTLLDVYNGKLNVNFLAKCCSIFSNINIQECFPIYNLYINKYLKASIRRHKLLKSAVTILDQIVSDGSYFHYWCKLPFDIRLLILEYIESKDLIALIQPDTICRLSLYSMFG